MKIQFLLFIIGATFCLSVAAQSNLGSTADYPRVIAPSPEAAALGKYAETPVSLFTGTPQIGVPLYNLANGDIKVDVSLNYNAGGIRLDDIATNVGLGWSLNAGGVITRSVLGVPDFVNDGFPDNPNDFDPSAPQFQYVGFVPLSTDYYVARDVITYNRDTERDIYYYNFLGSSGKFVFDSLARPCLIPANPSIKILPYNGTSYLSGFIIIDDKGYKYYFTATEGTGNVTTPCNLGEESTREYTSHYPSAWYLTKIESPGLRTVTFEYQSYTYTVKRSYKETKYIRDVIISGCYDLSTNNRQCTRIETINGLRIKKIILADINTEVVFGYSADNRLDLSYNGQNAGNSLDTVNLLRSGLAERHWYLSYGYFGSGAARRLKLLSVKEGAKPAHEFYYNETYSLPERLSFSQDHWGYYNGKSNIGLIPVIPERGVPTGANREPDFKYMQTGSLQKLKYPTGGFSEFIYEPHTNMVTEDSAYFVYELSSLNVQSNTGTNYTDQNFTLPANSFEIFVHWQLFAGNPGELIYGYITDPDNPSIIYKTITGTGSEKLYNLTPGQAYKLRIFRENTEDEGILTVSWYKRVTATVTHNKIISGGLRIKSIRNYSADNSLTNKKIYYYNELTDSTKSTAILPEYNWITYWDTYQVAMRNAFDNNVYDNPFSVACPYYVLYSSSRPEIGSGLDVSIGYRQVIETDTSSAINGRIIYKFSKPTDFIDDTTTFQMVGANHEWCKGLLLEKVIQKYNPQTTTFTNVSKTKNYYKTLSNEVCRQTGDSCKPNQKVIHNFRISYNWQEAPAPNDHTWAADYSVEKYFVISNWVFQDKTEEILYDPDTGDSLITSTKYYYDSPDHGFYTALEKKDSKGYILKTQNKYPPDYSGTAVYDTMIARNIISPVIEQKIFRNNILLTTNKVNYGLWQSDQIVAPDSLQFATHNNPLQTELDYADYDYKGNPLQFVYKDGVIKSYIWDYNKIYPVAECSNAVVGEIAYTSFETDGTGNWTIGSSLRDTTDGITGTKCYQLSNGNISNSSLHSGSTYMLSYWTKNSSALSITGTQGTPKQGHTVNGWTCFVHTITGVSQVSISGTGLVDELRLYPEGAQMTTYTYEPLIGLDSQCDVNNRITYYEYDGFGRLKLIRDQDRNILKSFNYTYQESITQ